MIKKSLANNVLEITKGEESELLKTFLLIAGAGISTSGAARC